jgi:hypothetical protein
VVNQLDELAQELEHVEAARRGFAYEGAAMGLSLLDYFLPRRARLRSFMQTVGNDHLYMLHVGAGWTLGKLPRSARHLFADCDPVLRWLAIDGYGFHEGFFHSSRTLAPPFKRPRKLSGYGLRAFDQGLGRSLWFARSAQMNQISETISAYPATRQADLWSGVGLACAYAGGISMDTVMNIFNASDQYQPDFAQGVAFPVKARFRARNMTPHAEEVSSAIWGCSGEQISRIADDTLKNVASEDDHAYEFWREAIRLRFQALTRSRSDQQPQTTR